MGESLPNHAEIVARTLAESGVEYLFGLPGGEIAAFMDACRRAGVRFLLTGHETSAAIMAQVLGQMTDTPGACAATLGPGATNLVSGVANAFLDRAPLLAFTAQTATQHARTLTHQRLDMRALFQPITKGSVTIGSGDTESLMRGSIALAAAPRPGPVHIALPSDVAATDQTSATSAAEFAAKQETRRSATIETIAARIHASKQPLVIVGLGVAPSLAPAIRAFVDQLGAPFLVTGKAKGILREDHPLFLGVASGMAIDRDIIETVRAADLVLGIGFDPVECDKTWFTQPDVVSIDSAFMAEGDYRPTECVGEISALLAQLAGSIHETRSWPSETLAARRQAILRTPAEARGGVSPLALLAILRSVFPANGIVSCDVGSHKFVMGQFWPAYEPGTFLMSNGLSSMGFGIPAAVAAQLARPNRHVMAVVGDGGMLMTAHDLALIHELKLPIVIVCLVDRSLSLIRVSQQRRGFPAYGVDFVPPDFAALSAAFGIDGARARTLGQARDALLRALENPRPMLLHVEIDMREYYELM